MNKHSLAPPWILVTERGLPIAIVPAGRPGEILNVEGWTLEKAGALVDAANQHSQSIEMQMLDMYKKLDRINQECPELPRPLPKLSPGGYGLDVRDGQWNRQ